VAGVIIAGEDRYPPARDRPDHSAAEAVVYRHWRHKPGTVAAPQVGELKGAWPAGIHDSVRAAAYVNHGRWCVDCPFGCGSAQYASRNDHRFFCIDCGHNGDHRWVEVLWPSELEISTIESALSARPDPTTRNWRPGEPIVQLVAENEAHDLPPAVSP
jgi:hypothetical protein